MTITERPLVFASEVEKRQGVALRGDGAYIWVATRGRWILVTHDEIDLALKRQGPYRGTRERTAHNIAIGKAVGSYP